jgi:GDP-6-deoxy-D-talose 4-dehydrogenase
MDNKHKRVLITGVQGFTGRYMAEELRKFGHEIYGLGNLKSSGRLYYQVDLIDYVSLTSAIAKIKPHWVVHLAAVSFVGHGDANDFYKINLMGTRNLLSALSENDPRPDCVLLAGSANIYGTTSERVITEDTPPNPVNDYAVSKLAMEYMARLWQCYLPIVIARPFNYTGVGQSQNFLLPKIVAHFQKRTKVIELGNLDVSRDFSDVRAVVTAYRKLLETRPSGEIINICSGSATSLEEIINMARSITGHNIEIKINPSYVRPNEVKSLLGNPGKLRSIIGEWNPPPIKETLRWMLSAE